MYSSRGWSYSTSPTPSPTGSAYRRRRRSRLSILPGARRGFVRWTGLAGKHAGLLAASLGRIPRLAPWLVRLGPLPLALAVVGGVAWYHFVFPGFTVDGSVLDSATGAGVAGARVWSGEGSATADDSGHFHLVAVKPPEPLSIAADGYVGVAARSGWPEIGRAHV